jgi:UDP-N-acetylmuramate-alanine ligase
VSAEIALALERHPKEGILIMNGDDARSQTLALKSPCPVLWYGMGPKNIFRLYDIMEKDNGSEAKIINTRTGFVTPIELSVYGQHHLLAAAAAHAAYEVVNSSGRIKKTVV